MVSKFSWWDQLRATVIAFLLLHFEIEAVTVSSYNPCVACWEILPRCNLECCRVVGICILRVGTSAADSYTPLPLLLNHQKIPLLLFCCAVHPSHLPPLPGLESSEPTFMCCLETFCLGRRKQDSVKLMMMMIVMIKSRYLGSFKLSQRLKHCSSRVLCKSPSSDLGFISFVTASSQLSPSLSWLTSTQSQSS